MDNTIETVTSTAGLWIPAMSLSINIGLALLVIYLVRKAPHNHPEKTTDQQIASVYKEAEFEASELMKDAVSKAKRIIEEAGETKDSLDSRLEKSLSTMSDSITDKLIAKEEEIYGEFKKVFENISQSYQSEGGQIMNSFKDEGETVLKTFIQTMHAEINSVREQLFGKIDSKMNLLEEDMEKYREEQYKRVDQNIKKIAKGTLEAYMKDALTSENHEQILFKSLEKFKKESDNKSTNV